MDMGEVIKKEYELAILVDNEIAEQELTQILEQNGAKITEKLLAKLVQLAYPIKKQTSATLLVYSFTAETNVIEKINKALKFQKNTLRFMIVTPPLTKISQTKKQKEPVKTAAKKQLGPELSSTEELAKTLQSMTAEDNK